MLLNMIAAFSDAGLGGIVTLSGETISFSGSSPARATVIFNTDGTVDKREGGVVSQIDAATDWIIPNGAADALYEVMWTVVGDAPTETNMASSGVWYALSTNRTVGYATGAPGSETGTFTLSIRYNGGPTIDSAAFPITAEEV